jgi:hypothetical protein
VPVAGAHTFSGLHHEGLVGLMGPMLIVSITLVVPGSSHR